MKKAEVSAVKSCRERGPKINSFRTIGQAPISHFFIGQKCSEASESLLYSNYSGNNKKRRELFDDINSSSIKNTEGSISQTAEGLPAKRTSTKDGRIFIKNKSENNNDPKINIKVKSNRDLRKEILKHTFFTNDGLQ